MDGGGGGGASYESIRANNTNQPSSKTMIGAAGRVDGNYATNKDGW